VLQHCGASLRDPPATPCPLCALPPPQVTDHSQGLRGASVSHASHAGGFTAGLLLAAALLPDFKGRRAGRVEALLGSHGLAAHLPPRTGELPASRQLWSVWQRQPALRCMLWSAFAAGAVALVIIPIVLYLQTFKRMACG
jgi:hypothetical protein